MIHEVTGDILLTKAQAIAHGVAPNDDFKTGLAHALREQWPAMYKDFRHYSHTQHPKEGGAWMWGGTDGRRIVALLTQEHAHDHGSHPGRATGGLVNHALRELRKMAEKENFRSLALPKLATGVGGLDWETVRPLIDTHLADLGIPVFVYTTYKAGVAADEPGA